MTRILNIILFGVLILTVGFFTVQAHQYGNIDPNNLGPSASSAWNDIIGWSDFHYDHVPCASTSTCHHVFVNGNEITGWASSSIGYTVLNCATTPNGNICGSSLFRVSNDGGGNLAGWAWNDNIGWISFCGNGVPTSTVPNVWFCPNGTVGQVIVSSGAFSGWAWNDIIGWISFSCANDQDSSTPGTQAICPGSTPPPPIEIPPGSGSFYGPNPYGPGTSAGIASTSLATVVSNIIDTNSSTTIYNTITWRGSLPTGASVKFEIATAATSSGPWNDADYNPPIYVLPDIPAKLIGSSYYQKRYIRYKITLTADPWQTASPRVRDVIINWSP